MHDERLHNAHYWVAGLLGAYDKDATLEWEDVRPEFGSVADLRRERRHAHFEMRDSRPRQDPGGIWNCGDMVALYSDYREGYHMSGIVAEGKVQMGEIEADIIIRKRPPENCAMGCPEHLSYDICSRCYRRPIKYSETATRTVNFDQTGEQRVVIKEG